MVGAKHFWLTSAVAQMCKLIVLSYYLIAFSYQIIVREPASNCVMETQK